MQHTRGGPVNRIAPCVFSVLPGYRFFQCLNPSPTTSATSAMMMNAFGSRETVNSFSYMAWRRFSTTMIIGRSAPV